MTRCIERRPFKTVADYPLETVAESNPEPRAPVVGLTATYAMRRLYAQIDE
jgi:hypothetical protein